MNLESDSFASQKFLLHFFGLLPNESIFYKVYSISLLFIITIYPFLVIPQILKSCVDFNKFIFSLVVEIGQFTVTINTLLAFWNRFKFIKLFEKLEVLDELSNFTNAKDENAVIKQYKDIVRKQNYFGYSTIIILLGTCTLVSIILSLNKEEWILPFGSGLQMVNNNTQFIIQMLYISVILTIFYLLLIIYINTLTLLCGHCKLLQHCLEISLCADKEEMLEEYNAELIESKIIDWEIFKVRLQDIVPYHVGIFDAADQMETTFSFIILIFFGGASSGLCFLIYHSQLNIEMGEFVKDVVLIAAGFSLLIIISSYGEEMITESGKIANVCYELDFTDCDLRIQKALLLIMIRAQRPITPTIGKFKILNLRTMLGVFQSIYSYYTILRNLKKE